MSRFAFTLTTILTTGGLSRALSTTVTLLTAFPAAQVPKPVGALVALSPDDVWETLALACLVITRVNKTGIRAIAVANAFCAIPSNGVTIVTRFTALAAKACGIVQTSKTSSSKCITVAEICRINVVVTRARLAAAAWDEWVSIVTVGTFFTLCSIVTDFAGVTDGRSRST